MYYYAKRKYPIKSNVIIFFRARNRQAMATRQVEGPSLQARPKSEQGQRTRLAKQERAWGYTYGNSDIQLLMTLSSTKFCPNNTNCTQVTMRTATLSRRPLSGKALLVYDKNFRSKPKGPGLCDGGRGELGVRPPD
jgi:hypothetical protein